MTLIKFSFETKNHLMIQLVERTLVQHSFNQS